MLKKPTASAARYSAGNPPFFDFRNPAVQISPDTEYHAVRISGASLTKSIGIQAPEKNFTFSTEVCLICTEK